MANANKLLMKVFNDLEEEKKYIKQYLLLSEGAINELKRIDYYIEKQKSTIKRLDNLARVHDNYKISKHLVSEKRKEYTILVKNTEEVIQYLVATNKEIENVLAELNNKANIQYKISALIMALKNRINKSIRKTERILKS